MVNSEAIKSRMKELNLRQKDAANCLGCRPSTACQKINNRRPMYLDEAWKLAILLGVAAVLNEPFSALEAAELNWATRILRAPIDLIQHMTTLEPHPQVMEVALCAFRAALGEIDEEVTDN